jgi:hypothetical protein
MYSKYRGQAFLRDYFEKRAAKITDFEQQYLDILQEQDMSTVAWLQYWKRIIRANEGIFSKGIQLIHHRFLTTFDEQKVSDIGSFSELDLTVIVNTGEYLHLLLQTSIARDPIDRDKYLFWLNYFIKRFEVRKKLFTAYHRSSVKKAMDEYRDYLNYALLSLTLLHDFEWSGNLKMVNAAIKLNDLLCSLSADLVGADSLLATTLALKKEANIIHQIMTDKQVAI